jgi:hypothetical protein
MNWKEFDTIRVTPNHPAVANPNSIKLHPEVMNQHFDKTGKESEARVARAMMLFRFLQTLPPMAINSIIRPQDIQALLELAKEKKAQVNLLDEQSADNPYELFLSSKGKKSQKQHGDDEIGQMLPDKLQIKKKLDEVLKEMVAVTNYWFDRYDQIKSFKTLLNKLNFIGKNFETAQRNISESVREVIGHLTPKVYVDDKGKLQKEDSFFLESLIDVEVTRIKRCRNCPNFFWANRIDRQCCTEKCADTYNKQASRERKQSHGEQYKQATKRRKNKKNAT